MMSHYTFVSILVRIIHMELLWIFDENCLGSYEVGNTPRGTPPADESERASRLIEFMDKRAYGELCDSSVGPIFTLEKNAKLKI